jgi:hypothetical protein
LQRAFESFGHQRTSVRFLLREIAAQHRLVPSPPGNRSVTLFVVSATMRPVNSAPDFSRKVCA